MEYITLAEILKPVGLKGEVKCLSMTSFEKTRFKKGTSFRLANKKNANTLDVTLTHYRPVADGFFALTFKEIPNPEDAETYRGWYVEIAKENAPLPEGYVRYDDLVGCKVYDTSDVLLGEVIEVAAHCKTPNLKIKKVDGGVFYVPYIKHFVLSDDVENKKVVLDVCEGML